MDSCEMRKFAEHYQMIVLQNKELTERVEKLQNENVILKRMIEEIQSVG